MFRDGVVLFLYGWYDVVDFGVIGVEFIDWVKGVGFNGG